MRYELNVMGLELGIMNFVFELEILQTFGDG